MLKCPVFNIYFGFPYYENYKENQISTFPMHQLNWTKYSSNNCLWCWWVEGVFWSKTCSQIEKTYLKISTNRSEFNKENLVNKFMSDINYIFPISKTKCRILQFLKVIGHFWIFHLKIKITDVISSSLPIGGGV